MRVAVLYASYKYFDCTEYFFNNAYYNDESVDYYIIDSNNSLESHIRLNKCIDHIKHNPNIKHIKRENVGLDFAAWSDALLNHDIAFKYDYYIFINDTCTGPFVPVGVNIDWVKLFTSRITSDVKLFGPVINYNVGGVDPHVQTFMFVTDNIGLKIGIDNKIFSNDIAEIYRHTNFNDMKNKLNYVDEYEIKFSKHILDARYNIASQQACLQGIDFRLQRYMNYINRPDGNLIEHSVYFQNRYFGTDLSPFELIFTKMKVSHLGDISDIIKRNIDKKYTEPIFNVGLITDNCIVQLKLPQNDWIELDIDTYFVYGCSFNNTYTDVTNSIEYSNNEYIIPSSLTFNEIFTDPVPMVTKALYIKIKSDRYIIPERCTNESIRI